MNGIRRFVGEQKTFLALVGGAVLGLVLGLAIGWWLWPVQWINSAPSNLRSDFQKDYVMWVVDSYDANGGIEWAKQKLGVELWKKGQLIQTLEELEQGQQGQTLVRLRNLKTALAPTAEAAVETEAAPTQSALVRFRPVILVCGVALVVAAIVGGVLLLVTRLRSAPAAKEPAGLSSGLDEVFPGPMVSTGDEPLAPQAQFVTSYALGDDRYDPSFTIETEAAEFMGECGVGVSETLGMGEPSRVTAFEIWLFDKNDIRTVTKVLMSEYAFHDDALRTKLAPKGEPVLAKIGDEVALETRRLRVRARALEVSYGSSDLPPNSFFSRLTLDLAAWVKPEQTITKPMLADEGAFA